MDEVTFQSDEPYTQDGARLRFSTDVDGEAQTVWVTAFVQEE